MAHARVSGDIVLLSVLFRCLKYFDKNAAALTRHAFFLSVSLELLIKILARDSLGLQEIYVYRAAVRWARAQLETVSSTPGAGTEPRVSPARLCPVRGTIIFFPNKTKNLWLRLWHKVAKRREKNLKSPI